MTTRHRSKPDRLSAMDYITRNAMVRKLHKDRISMRKIGERFGISRARVSQIIMGGATRDRLPTTTFTSALSTRSINALIGYYGISVLVKPEQLKKIGPRELRGVPGLGTYCIREIAAALKAAAVISNIEEWMGVKSVECPKCGTRVQV